MSSEETHVPKRRSSTGRRRRSQSADAVAAPAQGAVQQSTVATAEVVETVDRNVQRREERKAAKAQKPEKTGVSRVVDAERFSGVRRFYQDTMSEIRKVNWPDREMTRNLTLLVIALSVVLGTLLGGIDYVMLQIFEAIG